MPTRAAPSRTRTRPAPDRTVAVNGINRDLARAAHDAAADAKRARQGLREQLALNAVSSRQLTSLRRRMAAQRLLLAEAREQLAAQHGGVLSVANQRLLRRIDAALRPIPTRATA